MSCELAHDDAAYVLGALSPADRLRFERHLPGCADCRRAVRDLAGLPGLLARVPAELVLSPPVTEPVPETLLPQLVQRVRRARRRRGWVTVGAAAAVTALVVSVAALAISSIIDGDDPTGASSPTAETTVPGLPLSPVVEGPIEAELAMTSVLWGTKLELTCSYGSGGGEYDLPPEATYAMFVRTREGPFEQVASWRALPGKTMQLDAATAARQDDIASVEVRDANGEAVLRLVR